MTTRETLFKDRLPHFTEAQASDAYQRNGEVVSVAARAALPDLFLVAFTSEKNGTKIAGPFALNPLAARQLCKLLIEAGHEPALQ